jgi:hypothetical protein
VGESKKRKRKRKRGRTALDLPPFGKVSGDNLLHVVAHVDAPHVQRAVLAEEAPHAAHVVAVVAELVAAEAVDVRVEQVEGAR